MGFYDLDPESKFASEYNQAFYKIYAFINKNRDDVTDNDLRTFLEGYIKQILSWSVAERRGSRHQYIDGLQKVLQLLTKDSKEPTVLHTDQGSVYVSIAYNELIKDYNIQRSMSRAGKPTDNPVNESLNGWIKEELFMDFKIDQCRSREEFIAVIECYVEFYNWKRPCYSLGYDTPNNYYKRFRCGEIE